METKRVKAITSEVLTGGGSKQPGHMPEMSESPKAELGVPKDGLIISPLQMAEAILDGSKTLIVKTQPLAGLSGGQFVLLSGRKGLGVIQLGDVFQFGQEEFPKLENQHIIPQRTRERWCKQYKGWCNGPYFGWKVVRYWKFDEPKDTNVGPGPQSIVHGVVLKGKDMELMKIQDVDKYDPGKISDEVLRDDFRIALAWYANKKRNQNFTHTMEKIESILLAILREAVKRGPETITFRPSRMAPSVRQFFLRVAREAKVPPEQMLKSVVPVEQAIEYSSTDELLQGHFEVHKQLASDDSANDRLTNIHSLLVEELASRGVPHPPPPDLSGLDEHSADFVTKSDSWWEEPWEKIAKAEDLSQVLPSGGPGPMLHLDDVLPRLKDMRLRAPYIYLVGGLANHGKTDGDVDILVKDGEELPEYWRHVLEFRLGRALPAEVSKRLSIHYDRFHGPFTNHVPLYNLRLERVNRENEVIQMAAGRARSGWGERPNNLFETVEELKGWKRTAKGASGDAAPQA